MLLDRATLSRLLLVVGVPAVVAACGSAGASVNHPANKGRQYIVAVDLSGSRTASEIAENQQFTRSVVDRLENGDKLVLLEFYANGLRRAPRQWFDTVPSPVDPTNIMPSERDKAVKVRKAALQVLPMLFASDSAGKVMGTDIFSTLVRVGDYAHNQRRATTLFMLSDMLQAAKGVNMERSNGVPSDEWIAQQKAAGVLPSLTSVCVVVIGADPSTAHGARVREFWKNYFAATGAQLSDGNYRNMVDDPGTVGC